MINLNPLWLVIPCYNEAKRLNISAISAALVKYPWLNICFVDDNSSDDTVIVLNNICSNNSNASYITNPTNLGKANAVHKGIQEGLKNTEFSTLGFLDADLATPFTELEGMRNTFYQNPTTVAVLGSRVKLLGKNIMRKRSRHYLGRFFATLASNILKAPVYDTQCGAKIFSREFAEISFKNQMTTNWCFDIEMLFRFKQSTQDKSILEKSVVEYPVSEWKDIEGSKIKLIHYYGICKDLTYNPTS